MQGNSSVNNSQSYNAFYSPFGEGNIPYNISNLASLGINPFINISLPSALNGQAIDFTSHSIPTSLHSSSISPSVESSTTRNQFPVYSNSQAEDSRHPLTSSQREAKWIEVHISLFHFFNLIFSILYRSNFNQRSGSTVILFADFLQSQLTTT